MKPVSHNSVLGALAAGVFLVTLMPEDVLAQESNSAQEEESVGIEEIIVTARKRQESMQNVPIAITVLSGAAIESMYFNSMEGIQHAIPAMNFQKGSTTRNSALFLRGVGTISFSTAAEPSVSTIVDGVVYARSGMSFQDLYDIEQLEVLRGPQGTLFGKNASAGALNIVTRRPGDEFGGTMDLSAFQGNEYRASFAVDLPLSETIKARVTGVHRTFDGYLTNRWNPGGLENLFTSGIANLTDGPDTTPNGKVNGYSTNGVRGILTWQTSDDLVFTVIGDYSESEDDCCTGVIGRLNPDSFQRAALEEAFVDVNMQGKKTREIAKNLTTKTIDQNQGLSLQADYDFGRGYTFTSITAFRQWENTEIREGDNQPGTLTLISTPETDVDGIFTGNMVDSRGLFELHDYGPQEWKTFQQEFRIASPSGDRVEYQVGVFFYNVQSERSFTRFTRVCTASALDPIDSRPITDAAGSTADQLLVPCLDGGLSDIVEATATAHFETEFNNYAVFGQASWAINDRFRLMGGLRYTSDEIEFEHARVNPTGVAAPGVRSASFEGSDSVDNSELTGELALNFTLSDDLMPYAKYSRGYKGPAFNTFFNMVEKDTAPISKETADAFEVGIKSTFFDNRLLVNVAAFSAKYFDFQANNAERLPDDTIITRLTNAGDIKTKGIEVDFTALPLDNMRLNGGFAYTDAEIDKFNVLPGTPPEDADDRSGERLPYAPEWKAYVALNYLTELQNMPFDISWMTDFSYTGEQFTSLGANPDGLAESYGLWGANIALVSKDDKYRLTLIVKNLADNNYSKSHGIASNYDTYFVTRDAERYVGLALRASF